MKKALKIKSQKINDMVLSLCKTTYFYDIIIEGDINTLKKIKEKFKSESTIIEDGIYGNSILVLDTCDTEEDANILFKEYESRI